jgi:phosphoglucosamine mutase
MVIAAPISNGIQGTTRSESPLDPLIALFGTDGIRGRVGDLLTPALALQVGYWGGRVLQAQHLHQGPLILGQDSRNSSDMLAMALVSGLTAAGIEVWHLGLCPTPSVAYLTQASAAIGGIMVSASHNPPADNGIKFFGATGAKLSLDLQREIETRLQSHQPISGAGAVCGHYAHRADLLADYLQALQAPLRGQVDLSGMRIVLDLAWGAAVYLAPELFRSMGAQVICLHDRPDGDRINVNCGSTHLTALKTAVQLHQADIGFAFDGDADRVLAVDANGRTVDGDYILYLWGQTLRQNQQLPGDLIVATVMSNLGFERSWCQQGGKLIRAAVGDQYVQAEMNCYGAMLGGEQSGHILCPHYGVGGDGLLTALHLSALVKRSGTDLTELLETSFQTYPQLLHNVRVSDQQRRLGWHNCDPLQRAIAQAEADMGDQGRVLVRASGTEPVVRVMVEAATEAMTQYWTSHLVSIVEQHLAS